MFRPFPLFSLIECIAFFFRSFGFWFGIALCCSHFAAAKKVSPSVIVASIEGEVSSLNLEDEFKVQLGPTTVGKKINPKTILTTGKTGKVVLLFSNGTLITIKPGSRFYLRTYKQLEGIVEGTVDPGKLEEEPTQSELSAHLDFGDLVVKAPKLKKGSSMKLTSPLGTAGIRGTMFQLMAVRNSVTGDIMGGINLISGDIDFTDTGGNMVSLLSGQSIQLATSKLGAPVASQTGELVDLASTYGPALTDGFAPPPLESVFVDYSEVGPSESGEDSSSDSLFPTMPTVARTSISAVNSAQGWEMIHELATDLFFEIESSENVASGFTFESMALAPTIDIPTPEPETPVAPPSVTGETLAGADLEFFQGGHPELKLLGTNNSTDPLVKIFNNGARMQVEMRAPSEGITWRKIDPWVKAFDFLGNDITSGVQITGAPDILLANVNAAENEAPGPGASVSYEVSYIIRDLRGLNTVTFRQVDVVATRPTIEIANKQPSFPWNELDLDGDGKPYDSFYQWVSNQVTVQDVRGESLAYSENQKPGSFYLSGEFDLSKIGTFNGLKVVAIDWRGLRSESDPFTMQVTSPEKLPVLSTTSFVSNFPALQGEGNLLEYGDPSNELGAWLNGATAVDVEGNPVTVTFKISENEALSPLEIDGIFPGSGNRLGYTIVFEAVDPRWEAGGSDPLMKDQLTVSETQTIEVVATPPKLELIFHNPREGLGVSENQDVIRYLVRSKENVAEFPDDGPFAIAQDSGENNRQDRKLYYKATAYNGFGTDITDQVNISYDVPVDSSSLNELSSMTVKVNDQSVRGTIEGAETVLAPTIKIIDVIAPILNFPSGQPNPFVVEGIMPELALLNGSSKDQVIGNTDSFYYFNDPGIEIIDNYYTTDELHSHNGIDDSKSYTFEYTNVNDTSDTSDREVFNPVFEYGQDRIQTDLDMAKIGDYTLTYSLSDPSENRAALTRSITVKDTQAPVVKLYGSKTIYVDLQSIFDGESRYSDPGAFAIENLYKSEKGFFDWLVEDQGMAWRFTIQVCNNLEADTYGDAVPADNDFIASTIDGLADSPPTETIRYRFNYLLEDQAGNSASNFRTVELRGSPNLYPSIFFLLNHPDSLDGTPSNEYINSETTPPTATLPTLIWEIEVGENEYSQAPEARVFTDLGGGQRENLDNLYLVDLIYLNRYGTPASSQNVHSGRVSNFPNSSSFFSSVNYWNSSGGLYFISGGLGSYMETLSSSDKWRKCILRYSVENSLGNKSVRDIEVRLVDTTPPEITMNPFSDVIEVGEPFNDPGVVIADLAMSTVTEVRTTDIGADYNATFDELGSRGFWTKGEYTITYNAFDEFENQADPQVLNLNVQDSTDPHVAVITHDALEKYNSGNGLSISNLSYQNANIPKVLPNDIFQNHANLQVALGSLSVHYKNFTFSSEVPFLAEKNTKDFLLKSSELGDTFIQKLKDDPAGLVQSSSVTISIPDDFGRSFIWYSPFKLTLNDGSDLQDPGFFIYESSNSGISIDSTLTPVFFGDDQNQINSIAVNLAVTQLNTSARQTSILNARQYLFLDDLKPILQISPETDGANIFVKVEAGFDYDDESMDNSRFPILENGVVRDEEGEFLTVSAYDLSDGDITESITRKVEDLNGSGVTSVETGYDYVNHIYKIEYNATDSADPPNFADAVFRYLKILDTTPPLIYPQADAALSDNFEIDYLGDTPDTNLESEVQDYLLQGLVASDYGAKGAGNGQVIDANLDWSNPSYRDKWDVLITKPDGSPFEPGKVFPFAKGDEGYDVNITVTDEFGNTSLSKLRKLKVGDYKKPTITLIGSSEIHDFLRFSTNTGLDDNSTGPNNQELLFADQSDSKEFNSTGFSGGAHRILHGDYNFVDPGVYAEDSNSYFSTVDGYKDLDGDGIGETYAIRRVSERSHMTDCNDQFGDPDDDIGVIFAYSVLEKVENPTHYFQNLLADNTFGLDTRNLTDVNSTFPPEDQNNTLALSAVKVPDVEGESYNFDSNKTQRINMDVMKITIEYRVRDGWDNFSDIKERVVYIYESRQFPNFAFYATPLTEGDGTEFEHYYDDGTGRPFLNDTRKDTDRDGVSDYWEKVFGSDPLDKDDIPKDENGNSLDLSDPSLYTGNSINFNPANP
jgi:hypothetical protein